MGITVKVFDELRLMYEYCLAEHCSFLMTWFLLEFLALKLYYLSIFTVKLIGILTAPKTGHGSGTNCLIYVTKKAGLF